MHSSFPLSQLQFHSVFLKEFKPQLILQLLLLLTELYFKPFHTPQFVSALHFISTCQLSSYTDCFCLSWILETVKAYPQFSRAPFAICSENRKYCPNALASPPFSHVWTDSTQTRNKKFHITDLCRTGKVLQQQSLRLTTMPGCAALNTVQIINLLHESVNHCWWYLRNVA